MATSAEYEWMLEASDHLRKEARENPEVPTICKHHGPQIGYYHPQGYLVCAVPSSDGGMCHEPLRPQNMPDHPGFIECLTCHVGVRADLFHCPACGRET